MFKIKLDRNIKRLFKHFFRYKKRFIIAVAAAVLVSSMDTSLPIIIGKVMDIIGRNAVIPHFLSAFFQKLKIFHPSRVFILNFFVIMMFIILFFKSIFSYVNTYLMQYINNKIIFDLRDKMLGSVLRYKLDYFDRHKTGQIISRFTNDIVILKNTTSSFKTLIQSGAYIIVILTVMFTRHFKLTLFTLIVYPFATYTMKTLGRKIKSIAINLQDQIAVITDILQDVLTGIRIIKIFSKERYELNKFSRQNEKNYSLNMKLARVDARFGPILQFISFLSTLIIFWFGAYLMLQRRLTVGELVEFLGMVVLVYKPIKDLGSVTSFLQKASVSAGRVYKIIDYPDLDTEGGTKIDTNLIRGAVEFKNVNFSYNQRRGVLKDINIKIKAYRRVAIVGHSGSGKSTIPALLFRLYDIKSGHILIDNKDIRELDLHQLRGLIGLVPQDTFLFSTTIMENIKYGRTDATDEEIINASKSANAYEFIMQLPSRFGTIVGERGLQLSGGERQRISIARTLLKNPKILILDEATSSLDTESERLVQDALDKLIVNRTTITIAHRLSTVLNSDTIFVIDNGQIVETGSHKQLLEKKGLYYKLCRAQYIIQ